MTEQYPGRPPVGLRPFVAVLLGPASRPTSGPASGPTCQPARRRGTVGRTVLALLPAFVAGAAHALLVGPLSDALAGATAVLAVVGAASLAWLSTRAEDVADGTRGERDTLAAESAEFAARTAERFEESVRGAFVQQQFTERQSRTRAQEVVDDSSSTIVARLAEVEEQVGQVQASTAVIDDKALAAASATQEILAQAAQADHDVKALEDSLGSVESMASVIAKVADQTKLLALNATIEAARAGAAGDGFRVVAGEVKSLAATTAGSTQEIATTVATVQANAHAVLRSLRAVQDRIAGIDEAAAGLRSVADAQRGSLDLLHGSVAAAVEGARQMGDLAATMERRRVSRFPCRQHVVLRVDGAENPATALDLGLGGARVTTGSMQRIGVGTRVVVHWPHRGTTLDLAGAVARVGGGAGRFELGVVFDTASVDAPAGLVEVVDSLRSRVSA